MTHKTILLLAIASAISSGASLANAATPVFVSDQAIAREASEAPRGRDNERPGDRHRRGGKAFDDSLQLAREASEAPRGRDNERPGDRHRRGGRLFEEVTVAA